MLANKCLYLLTVTFCISEVSSVCVFVLVSMCVCVCEFVPLFVFEYLSVTVFLSAEDVLVCICVLSMYHQVFVSI